jgi:uncharacterized membrane protein
MSYVVLKWLHVVSSTLLFGTGIGSAFYLLVTSLKRDPRVVASVASTVVVADWLFTATTVVFQPVSGFLLARIAHFPLDSAWLVRSMLLYALAVLCWLPVIVLQMRLRDLARAAAAEGAPLPPAYWRCLRLWVALGVPALLAFLAVFYLMVAKPA